MLPLHSEVSGLGPSSPVPTHCPSDNPARAGTFKVSFYFNPLSKNYKEFQSGEPRGMNVTVYFYRLFYH